MKSVRFIAGAVAALLMASGTALPSAAADPGTSPGPNAAGSEQANAQQPDRDRRVPSPPGAILHTDGQSPISKPIALIFIQQGLIFIPVIPPGLSTKHGAKPNHH